MASLPQTVQFNIDDCNPNPCMNNGSCKDLVNNYSCECAPSYIGRNCSSKGILLVLVTHVLYLLINVVT